VSATAACGCEPRSGPVVRGAGCPGGLALAPAPGQRVLALAAGGGKRTPRWSRRAPRWSRSTRTRRCVPGCSARPRSPTRLASSRRFQPAGSSASVPRKKTRELLQPGVGRGRAATAAHAAPGRREACEPCACTDRGEDDDLVSGNQRPELCVRGGRPATLGQGVDGLLRGAISLSVRAGRLVEHRGPWDVQHGAWRVPSRRSRIAAE
jgi:hypothetical protein